MEDLTQHILALQQEQKEHPERFTLTIVCDGCGSKHEDWFQKDEVTKYLEKHNGNRELHHWSCEKCKPKETDDET